MIPISRALGQVPRPLGRCGPEPSIGAIPARQRLLRAQHCAGCYRKQGERHTSAIGQGVRLERELHTKERTVQNIRINKTEMQSFDHRVLEREP